MLANATDIELVIFDCDGVLIDSEILSATILIDQLAELDIQIGFDHVQEHYLGRSFPKVAEEISKCFGCELPQDFEHRYRQKLLAKFQTHLQKTTGIEGVLDRLAIKRCVATSSSPTRVSQSLQLVDLAQYFGEDVFTASEVAYGKPAPDLFLHAAGIMGVVPEKCLVVEDSLPGVEAALAANMGVLRFMGGSHLKNAAHEMSGPLSKVKTFDKWSNFFDISPELKVSGADAHQNKTGRLDGQ